MPAFFSYHFAHQNVSLSWHVTVTHMWPLQRNLQSLGSCVLPFREGFLITFFVYLFFIFNHLLSVIKTFYLVNCLPFYFYFLIKKSFLLFYYSCPNFPPLISTTVPPLSPPPHSQSSPSCPWVTYTLTCPFKILHIFIFIDNIFKLYNKRHLIWE